VTRLEELCRCHTLLRSNDIELLAGIEKNLQLIANLADADIFIDCLTESKENAIVVSQAKPRLGRSSLYQGSVVGMPVYRHNEPAVFHALESGKPIRDLKALTQEAMDVKQDVVPIFSGDGIIIGVLIRERDISSSILQEKKYNTLARQKEEDSEMSFPLSPDLQKTVVRETYHRVKNSLQLVASILNLQARQAQDSKIRQIFEENVARVLSIASTHDMIAMSDEGKNISLRNLLKKVACNAVNVVSPARPVRVEVDGDDIALNGDTASSVALVVNELISNAVLHGFEESVEGKVSVTVHSGILHSAIWVEDNGCGFDSEEADYQRLGLQLVSLMVREKLKGDFFVSSSDKGTKASFSFKLK
jgi:two-component sensor histidine kinase